MTLNREELSLTDVPMTEHAEKEINVTQRETRLVFMDCNGVIIAPVKANTPANLIKDAAIAMGCKVVKAEVEVTYKYTGRVTGTIHNYTKGS